MRVKDDIVRLLRDGLPYNRIAEELGCSKSTVAYHARKVGIASGHKLYDWLAVQQYYDAGHSIRQCMREYGFSSCAWYGACRTGSIIPKQEHRLPLAPLMQEG